MLLLISLTLRPRRFTVATSAFSSSSRHGIAPSEANDPNSLGNIISGRQIYLPEASDETDLHLGSDSLCVLRVCGVEPAAKGQNNWSEFHRTNMVRWNPYENVINVHNVGHLQPKWSFATGSPVVSSPAVANGVVYVGSNNGIAYALKASSGTKLWSYYVGNSVFLTRSSQWSDVCRLL